MQTSLKKRIFPNNKNNIHENFMFEEQKRNDNKNKMAKS